MAKSRKHCVRWFTTVEADSVEEAKEAARDEVREIQRSGDMLDFDVSRGKCPRPRRR